MNGSEWPSVLGTRAVGCDAAGRAHLVGSHCLECDGRLCPPADVCPICGGERLEAEPQPVSGVLYTFTVLHVVPPPFSRPMTLGYVDLPNGVRVLAHLKGGQLKIGQQVTMGIDQVGADQNGRIGAVVFRAVEASA